MITSYELFAVLKNIRFQAMCSITSTKSQIPSVILVVALVGLVELNCIRAEVVRAIPGNTNDGDAGLILNLDDNWSGSTPNKPGLTFEAKAPFTIHTALMREGKIGDPYFRFNDNSYRWISTFDWLINKYFDAPPQLSNHQRINLVFKGIDTISDVYLNNAKIGATDNKFVPYSFDITDKLKKGKNTISIWLKSPIYYAKQQSLSYRKKFNYSVLPNCYPEVLHGECHSNFIRKEPCSFGWDFGPSFPTQGLSDHVYLEAFSEAKLREVNVHTKRLDGWELLVTVFVESIVQNVTMFIRFEVPELHAKETIRKVAKSGMNSVIGDFLFGEEVEPWWPNGFGKQMLYSLKVTLLDNQFRVLQSKTLKIGFRTVELIQEPIPESKGLSFYFKINSVPIFLKGSNWIPADALRDRVTNDVIDDFLHSAVEANMNVLRVWGGGGYEIDYFYETCDRLGLMIWHDLMFACAMYPADQSFLGTVKSELAHQLRRLQYHPSIIVWSANNENEVALRENWYGTEADFGQYKSDYIKLYVDTVMNIVHEYDVTRPFIVSSPSNGVESETEGWIAKTPRSPYCGDAHVYDYVNNCWNDDIFPKPRLASEYGYQSYPSIYTLMNVTVRDDLIWNSTLMFYRQHHQNGNKQIENLIKQNFQLPVHKDPRVHFEHLVYMSQVVQALCIQFETEHYRRLMGRLETPNRSHDKTWNRNSIDQSSNEAKDSGSDLQGNTMGASHEKTWNRNSIDKSSVEAKDSWSDLQGNTMGASHDKAWNKNSIDQSSNEAKDTGSDLQCYTMGASHDKTWNRHSIDQSSNEAKDSGSDLQGHTMRASHDKTWNKNSIDKSSNEAKHSGSNLQGYTMGASHDKTWNRNSIDQSSDEAKDSGSDLQGYTMGAMYWQLNDIWQAPSWASIEYGGRWKMLHYYAKKFFSPIGISTYIKDNKIEVFVVSDSLNLTHNVVLNITIHHWANFDRTQIASYVQDIPMQSSVHIASVNINETCADITNCFLILKLVVPEKPVLNSFRPVFLTPFSKVSKLGDPRLKITKIAKSAESIVQFTITASRPAAFVWLSTSAQGHFSDNGFVMYDEYRVLNFTAKDFIDVTEFAKTLKLVSLYNMYN